MTRNTLIGQPGIRFRGLTLAVTDERGVLKVRWVELIFRDEQRKRRKTLPNQNIERSYLGTLLAKAPEGFHDAIREVEAALRAIRRKARKVNEARRLATPPRPPSEEAGEKGIPEF